GVQGIPFVVLMRDGRPVDAFQGALPEAEVVAFLERNGIRAGAAHADGGDETPAVDPNSPSARYERARMLAADGDVVGATAALEGLPEEEEAFAAAQRLAAGFAWLEGLGDAAVTEAGRHLEAARHRFLARDYEGAMGEILASATVDRGFRDGLARRAMLTCFAVVGEEDERLDDFRRRLATLLY
ncbi:MAG: tetratricopeptide repeat protein, partial [Planctomycetes bacterium]|nr:tetratricopeptide repeat protein [Planctomycetota bacterium]